MRALPLVALLLLATACGAAPETPVAAEGRRISGHGLEITLPDGWYGDVTDHGAHHAATLRAATFPVEPLNDVGHTAQRTMDPDDLLIVVANYGGTLPGAAPAPDSIRLTAENVVNFEGFLEPVGMTSVNISGASLQIWVVAADAPSRAQLERANEILATFRLERARWRTYVDEAGGLSAGIPTGWDVAEERLTPYLGDPKELLNVGTGAFEPGGDRCAHVPERTLEALGPEDALVTVLEFETVAGHRFPERAPALLEAESWKPDSLDCLDDPLALDFRLIPFTDAGRDFYVYVAFGARAPEARRREAEQLLASLRFDPGHEVSFDDPALGVSGRHPAAWHRARGLTAFTEPREVFALATYPLRGGAEAGECAPDTARADMPAGGAFIWLLEYLEELPPDRFPARPTPFPLAQEKLAEHISCFPGPGWTTTFGDAGRQFQLLVAFGGRPTDERLREVEAVLEALQFEPLPVSPEDREASWPLLTGSAPDSMRAPPGWAAAAARFSPAEGRRPRTLFFASNRPLLGLPGTLEREPQKLPEPIPGHVLANDFPPDGVLVWAVEEHDRQTLVTRFSPIDRHWPAQGDFEPVQIATKPNPDLRWVGAGGEFRGHRFSVWIARGPAASEADLDLALRSAGTLAVSGCDRGVGERCVETR